MTKLDRIIIAIIACASIVAIFLMPKINGAEILCEVDGVEVYRSGFSDTVKTKTIETDYGYNTIEIGSDYVAVVDANCPNKLDVKQGKIGRVGESIICIPHHLVIRVVSNDEESPDVIVK